MRNFIERRSAPRALKTVSTQRCSLGAFLRNTRTRAYSNYSFPYSLRYFTAMGNDGGSVPQGSDLRKVKKALKKTDHTEQNRTRWLTCALSKATLAAPIVADLVGNIFNKESVIKALIGKSLPKEYSHIRSLKVRPRPRPSLCLRPPATSSSRPWN